MALPTNRPPKLKEKPVPWWRRPAYQTGEHIATGPKDPFYPTAFNRGAVRVFARQLRSKTGQVHWKMYHQGQIQDFKMRLKQDMPSLTPTQVDAAIRKQFGKKLLQELDPKNEKAGNQK